LGEPYFFSSQATRLHWDVAYPERVALVFGRESVGLPRALLERYADRTVRIPMVEPTLRSINLSTSAGIALFEVVRQRAFSGR
jgi:tRNA (cytidine/uridine-2'-O-)-methyltransferase